MAGQEEHSDSSAAEAAGHLVLNEEDNAELQQNLTKTTEEMLARLQQTPANRIDAMERYKPGPLPARGHDLADTVDFLSTLVTNEGNDSGKNNTNILASIAPMDETANAAIVSHSLATFFGNLRRPYLNRLVSRLTSETTLWISRLFRFFDTSASFHDEPHEGVVRLCRALLRKRYQKYDVDGYESLYPRPPVIYLSPAIENGLAQTLCNKLGLPRSCVCFVPSSNVGGEQSRMDVSALERSLHEDFATQRTPLLVVANAGASLSGQVDNLQQLQDTCKTHDVWLHVEGHSLAALCLVPAPTLPAKVGDSMTLRLGEWLGVYGLSDVTLYKSLEPSITLASGLVPATAQQKLNCLPLWTSLLTLGHDGVISRIHHSFRLTRHLHEKIGQISSLKLVGKDVAENKQSKVSSISELTSKAVSTAVLFDFLSPTVAFQFVGQEKFRHQLSSDENSQQVGHRVLTIDYFNCLNSWLQQILERDVPRMRLEIAELRNNTICVRYCPLEGIRCQSLQVTMDDIEMFINCLHKQVDILNATVKHKIEFPSLVAKHTNLVMVDIPEWAGLGSVKYIPHSLKENMNELSDSGKEELNRINEELVMQLKATDSAFSLGEGEDRVYCVRFGMVTEDTDMEELLELVVKGGNAIEESSKNLEGMKEMIKKGIKTANEDMQKENDDRIWQEGILRQVPVVGSVFNWWAPLPKETGVKGRSFNLSSGVIESTENIYKYHMQLQEGSSPTARSPTTPKPAVQTPIVVNTTGDASQSQSQSLLPPPREQPQQQQQHHKQKQQATTAVDDKSDST